MDAETQPAIEFKRKRLEWLKEVVKLAIETDDSKLLGAVVGNVADDYLQVDRLLWKRLVMHRRQARELFGVPSRWGRVYRATPSSQTLDRYHEYIGDPTSLVATFERLFRQYNEQCITFDVIWRCTKRKYREVALSDFAYTRLLHWEKKCAFIR